MIRRFLKRGSAVAMVLIGIMGLLKLADLPAFGASVHAWTIIPRSWQPALTVLIPFAEVAVAGCWAAGIARVRCEWAALTLVLMFSGVYATQWAIGGPPPCGCFGAMARHFHELEQARFVIARNAGLAALLAAGVWARKDVAPPAPAIIQSSRPGIARGFTLIETILVIFLVGLLVSLLAPSLSRARDSARELKSAFNLRSHAAVLAAYTSDFKDLYPALTDPAASSSVVRCESAGLAVEVRYFDAYLFWNIGLADQYYSGAWNHASFWTPWDPPGSKGATSYHMACSFLADPAYYNRLTRVPPPTQLRAVHASEVLFPSAKGILTAYTPWVTDSERSGRIARFQAATTDGRAGSFSARDTLPQYPTADGPYPLYTSHDYVLTPMTHTVDGARGRDTVR